MKKRNRGFTLIELLGVIVISTLIIVPVLNSMMSNYEINQRMHSRKSASSLAVTTVQAFDKIYFSNLLNSIDENDHYALINESSCANFTITPFEREFLIDATELCERIFSQTWVNFSYDEEDFRVYLFPYTLESNQKLDLLSQDFPQQVHDYVQTIQVSSNQNNRLLHIVVWIRYDEATNSSITSTGVISRD